MHAPTRPLSSTTLVQCPTNIYFVVNEVSLLAAQDDVLGFPRTPSILSLPAMSLFTRSDKKEPICILLTRRGAWSSLSFPQRAAATRSTATVIAVRTVISLAQC